MGVFVVCECMIVEHEESFRVMSVHSSMPKAEAAIAQYEAEAKQWKKATAFYTVEECELDINYYDN